MDVDFFFFFDSFLLMLREKRGVYTGAMTRLGVSVTEAS